MNTFDDRKKGFEAKYQKDQEAQFKIRSIRNRLVGEWAAELFHPTNEDEYIKEVRLSDLEKPGDDDIIDKLVSDFESKTINMNRQDIIKKIAECENLAINEFNKKIIINGNYKEIFDMLSNSNVDLKVCGITTSQSILTAANNSIRSLGFASNNLLGPNTCNDEFNKKFN